MQKVISKSLADILSPAVLRFVLMVGFGSILLWVVILSLFWGSYSAMMSGFISKIPFVGGWEWFATSGSFVVALLMAYMLIISTISILTSLLSEPLLIQLAKKHYPTLPVVGTPSVSMSLLLTLKATAIFLLLFAFTIPLLFVPIVGQIWMLWLWSILIKEPTAYDVGSLFISDKIELKEKRKLIKYQSF